MTQNASISKDENGQFTVTAYREVHCPACGRIFFESQVPLAAKIICSRCGGMWKMEGDRTIMLRPPKRIAGKMLLNGVEKFYK
jgi:DNA-directed RNA polymerase subunit RPC12/RpoP